MFTWVDGVTDEEVKELEADLRADVASFPQVKFYACGTDLELDANADAFAVVAGADSVEDLKTYLDDEGHKAIVSKWKRLFATRNVVEFNSNMYLNGHDELRANAR
jgi:hypothetical protein